MSEPARSPPVRCSCGQHDLAEGPLEACHFCGHATLSRPVIDWSLGRVYFPICHACVDRVRYEDWFASVRDAPYSLLSRAMTVGEPAHGVAQA